MAARLHPQAADGGLEIVRGPVVLGIALALYSVEGLSDVIPSFLTPAVSFASRHPAALILATIGLSFFNSWYLSCLLAPALRTQTRIKTWVHTCRSLLSAVPLLGVSAFPLWNWLLRRKPTWAVEDPGAPFLDRDLPSKSLYTAPLVAPIHFFSNLLIFTCWTSWVADLTNEKAVSAALRILAFITIQVDLVTCRRRFILSRAKALFLHALSILWLFSSPLWGIAALGHLYFHILAPKPRLLMSSFFKGRFGFHNRLEDSPRADWWRPSQWRIWRSHGLTSDQESGGPEGPSLRGLYRSKTFLLSIDAMGLILALGVAIKAFPGAAVFLLFLWIVLSISIPVAVLGLLVLVGDFLARHLGRSLFSKPSSHSSLKYLVLSQISLLAGLYFGFLLLRSERWLLGLSLAAFGFVASFIPWLLSLPILPSRGTIRGSSEGLTSWALLFSLMGMTGVGILSHDLLASLLIPLLLALTILSPVLAWGVGLRFGGPLSSLPSLPFTLRGAALFCRWTSYLPLGGLAVPLWILFRQHLESHVTVLPSMTSFGAQGTTAPTFSSRTSPGLKAPETRHYFFSHAVSHLAEAKDPGKLFRLLEQTDFLKEQLAYFNAFSRTSEDVESHAILAAIEEGDWNRFIHFMMVAINLRGTIEDLPNLLESLVQSGQISIALEAVNRIANPLDRSAAKAMIAHQLDPDSEEYRMLFQSLNHDFAVIPPLPLDSTIAPAMVKKQLLTLFTVGFAFGSAVGPLLSRLVADLPDFWKDTVWGSIAAHELERGGICSPAFWNATRNIQDQESLEAGLVEELSTTNLSDRNFIPDLVDDRTHNPRLLWLYRFAVLERIARTSPREAWDRCCEWVAEHPITWSARVAEVAGPYLRRLDDWQIEVLSESIEDLEMRIAVGLSLLSPDCSLDRLRSVRMTIDQLPRGAHRVHWKLLWIASGCSGLTRAEIGEELIDLSSCMRELGHGVERVEIQRFLELIADFLPERLAEETEQATWAPQTGPEVLFELAENTRSEALLSHLLEKSDHYVVVFSSGESEGFLAWRELLQKLVPRLCVLEGNLNALDRGIEMNLEDADDLRTAVSKALIAAGRLDLAESVCNSMVSQRLKTFTRLQMMTTLGTKILTPDVLFASLTDGEMIHDEILGLQALAMSGSTPRHLLYGQVRRMQSHQEQFLALLRVIERLNDPLALVELVQAVGLVTSDTQLTILTAEVAPLVVSQRRRRAFPETKEALYGLLDLRSVVWPVRRDACEVLLSRLLPVLVAQAEESRLEAIAIGQWMADLLKQLEYGANKDVEERGIIPVVFAVMDRLPIPALKRFVREIPSEGAFPALYLADDVTLGKVLDLMFNEENIHPLIMETVLYLLSARVPGIVPRALSDLDAGPYRDTVASSLLRHGWLPAELSGEVLPLIDDPRLVLSTELSLGLACAPGSEEEDVWLHSLASLESLQLVDPTDPRNEPWLRKLRTIDPEHSRPILARAVLKALANQGRWHGLSALCLWLHAHLTPNGGTEAEVSRLCSEALSAAQKGLNLSPSAISTNV